MLLTALTKSTDEYKQALSYKYALTKLTLLHVVSHFTVKNKKNGPY